MMTITEVREAMQNDTLVSSAVSFQNDSAVSLDLFQDTLNVNRPDTFPTPKPGTGDSLQVPIMPVISQINDVSENASPVDLPQTFPYETEWNTERNFLMENPLSDITLYVKRDSMHLSSVQAPLHDANEIVAIRNRDHTDWLTGLGLLILFLFIWIRIFYGKFYNQLADSMINYQISAKLYLEKNILTRRVSLVLNIVYFIVLALFIYEWVKYTVVFDPGISDTRLYGMILGILLAYSIARIAMLRLTGFVFGNGSLFAEYIHHTYVYNKGLGLILFPLVILMAYIPPGLAVYVLLAGAVVYLLGFVFKAVRAYKIILRKDVLIFYMILYLCTLEILPLLLGYKLLKALILSY